MRWVAHDGLARRAREGVDVDPGIEWDVSGLAGIVVPEAAAPAVFAHNDEDDLNLSAQVTQHNRNVPCC
jgi:hypothetical protein